jgi:hypothetical protein
MLKEVGESSASSRQGVDLGLAHFVVGVVVFDGATLFDCGDCFHSYIVTVFIGESRGDQFLFLV